MTTTQNVTELQPRMTREQLIDAARKAAPLLPPASQWLMNELANRAYILADMLKVVDECWQVGTPSQWQMSLTGTKKVKKEPVIYAGAVLMSHPGRSMLFHQS
ncbi:hypothetical protein MLJ03_05740 [Escherichia coli]|nr:hypothetical protein [Escherichia coli]MCN9086618.1 hypothetical protein [Escherichia coli]MCO0042841.1 hypothetical protein [Escherichia coli]